VTTRAMLLCAGYGTRLGPLSEEWPKPLLPVCDVPIVRYGVALLVGHGVRDIVVNLHHKGDLIERELGDGAALGARIRYSYEEVILGTGGALVHALPLLDPDGTDEPFISMNGKLIFDLDVTALLEAHRADPDTLGTMVVRRVPDAREWGALDVRPDDAGRLRVRDVFGGGEHMFCGVHVTRPSVVRRLPAGEACSIRQGYLPWLRDGEKVGAFEAGDVYFAEHSTPARYLESNVALVRGARLRFPPAELRGVAVTAHVHPSVRIRHPVRIGPGAHLGEGAVIGPDAVVGAHAVVDAGATVERAVVFGGARAAGAVRDAIVTARAKIPAVDPPPSPPPASRGEG
jgi:mannose-1-phosphate guanylyltransferase